MNDRAFVAGLVLSVAVATAVMLTGCAAIQRSETRSTEHLLAAAGFELRPADTAEQQQHLAALPPFRLESHSTDGKVVYIYADPDGCHCLYVGGSKEYSVEGLADRRGYLGRAVAVRVCFPVSS